jgi:hypothetical protein
VVEPVRNERSAEALPFLAGVCVSSSSSQPSSSSCTAAFALVLLYRRRHCFNVALSGPPYASQISLVRSPLLASAASNMADTSEPLWLPWLLWLLLSFCSFCGFCGWGVYAHPQGRSSGAGPVPLLLNAVFLVASMAGKGRETWQWERGARKFVRSCVKAARCACLCVTRMVGGAGVAADCGLPRAARLLETAWAAVADVDGGSAAAGVLKANKMQKMMLLLRLGAEDSQELNRGCWCGKGRAARVAARVCDGRVCGDVARANAMECAWTCVPSFAVAGLGCSVLFVRAHV